jgi:hypothetical protein
MLHNITMAAGLVFSDSGTILLTSSEKVVRKPQEVGRLRDWQKGSG